MRIVRLAAKANQKFGWGYCAEFAVALHEVFGWPLGVFYEIEPPNELFDDEGFTLAHAFAYAPNGLADHRGIRSRETIKANLMSSSMTPLAIELIREQKTTPQDLENESGEGINRSLVDEAKQWILRNKKLYVAT